MSTRSRAVRFRANTFPRSKKAVKEATENGALAGYPMVDVKVTLFDGSYHDVDSSEIAFKIAGSMAFKEAARKASPVLLEPIMSVEVVVPEDFMGDVIGDLSSRRGKVLGMDTRPGGTGDRRPGAAGADVRLCHRSALDDPRQSDLHDAVFPL